MCGEEFFFFIIIVNILIKSKIFFIIIVGLYAIMSLYYLFCFVLIDLYNDFDENYLYKEFYVDYFPLNY